MTITAVSLLKGLTSDPILASDEIIGRVRQEERQRGGRLAPDEYFAALVIIKKLANVAGLDITIARQGDAGNDFDGFAAVLKDHIRNVHAKNIEDLVEAEFISKNAKSFLGYAVLKADEKKEILERVETIRSLIENSGLDDKKKNALFEKLNAFSKEVTKNGTRTDSLFTFLGELSFTAGIMARNAKPAIEEAKAITKIVVSSRAEQEGVKLLSPENILQLPNLGS